MAVATRALTGLSSAAGEGDRDEDREGEPRAQVPRDRPAVVPGRRQCLASAAPSMPLREASRTSKGYARAMDSVTQLALGAAVGEACLGRRVGWPAAAWGAALGALPDLDAALGPLLDPLTELELHRGLTHSLLWCALAPPLVALGLGRLHREREATARGWWLLAALVFATHVLIDCCTTFGTQVWAPFSSAPVAFRCVSVIDPLVTLPLLVGLAAAVGGAPTARRRRWGPRVGLGLAALYLLWAVGAKLHVEARFRADLAERGVAPRRVLSKPTLFNTVLWRLVAEDERGFWVGHRSLLDDADRPLGLRFVPKGHGLLAGREGDRAVRALRRITAGWFQVAPAGDGGLVLNDLRYGRYLAWADGEDSPYVFRYRLTPTPAGLAVAVPPRGFRFTRAHRDRFAARVLGR